MPRLGKAAATVFSAIDRAEQMVLATPALLARMQLLPAERMLAAVEPGYSSQAPVAACSMRNLNNGSTALRGTPRRRAVERGLRRRCWPTCISKRRRSKNSARNTS